jgi:hypothetical protein
MSNFPAGAMLRTGLFLVLSAVAVCAAADEHPLYVAPGPNTLIAPDVIKRNQDQLSGSARKLGDLLGNSLESKSSRAIDLTVTTR